MRKILFFAFLFLSGCKSGEEEPVPEHPLTGAYHAGKFFRHEHNQDISVNLDMYFEVYTDSKGNARVGRIEMNNQPATTYEKVLDPEFDYLYLRLWNHEVPYVAGDFYIWSEQFVPGDSVLVSFTGRMYDPAIFINELYDGTANSGISGELWFKKIVGRY